MLPSSSSINLESASKIRLFLLFSLQASTINFEPLFRALAAFFIVLGSLGHKIGSIFFLKLWSRWNLHNLRYYRGLGRGLGKWPRPRPRSRVAHWNGPRSGTAACARVWITVWLLVSTAVWVGLGRGLDRGLRPNQVPLAFSLVFDIFCKKYETYVKSDKREQTRA